MKRPWIPIAFVVLFLVASTLVVGSLMRSRLADAELVLEPYSRFEVLSQLGGVEDLPNQPCDGPEAIVATIGEFSDAVDEDRALAATNGDDEAELIVTDPTFDSFLLRSAIARMTVGRQLLLLRVRPGDEGWCVAEAEFVTEE